MSSRGRGPAGGILVVHTGKHHSYQVALALQRVGQLRQFLTSFYYKPASFPYSLIPSLPPRLRASVVREFEKRLEPSLDPHLVRTWPYAEFLSRTVGRTRLVDWVTNGRAGYPFVNATTDFYFSRLLARMRPPPAAVYGFWGVVLRTFTRARRLGIQTIMDVPIVFDADDVLRREWQALGLRTSVKPPLPSIRLARELALADWVIVPSPDVAESVRRAGFVGRGISIVPFGVDTSLFRPAAARGADHPFRVVCAARLQVRKGIHYLLNAWRDAHLVGELTLAGSPGEEEFVARLRSEYQGLFTEAGNLTHAELAALFASSDVFVLPSLAEGSAYVTYEALASGLPCIVTPEAGSMVRDGIEGFVVPARDVAALRNRLEQLYHDRELRAHMARAARARATEFTWQRYHRELVSVIAQIVERGREPETVT